MRFNIINFFIDADAPIIQISNFSLIGDLFKVVPELTEKLKKLKWKHLKEYLKKYIYVVNLWCNNYKYH